MANVTNTIGEAIARTMDQAKGPSEAMSDEQITARILQLKVSAGNAILEIGHWLVVMKSRLEHGAWGAWLAEQVDFSERIAQQYMRLSQEYGSNPNALSDLGKTKALKLLSIPADERSDFVQTYDVPNMSTRELETAIRERDEAREAQAEAERRLAAERADADARAGMLKRASDEVSAMQERVRKLESRPVDVAVETDYAAIAAAEERARAEAAKQYESKISELNAALNKAKAAEKAAKDLARDAKANAKSAGAAALDAANQTAENAKAEAERLRQEPEKMRQADGAEEKDVGALLEKLKADGAQASAENEEEWLKTGGELYEIWQRFDQILEKNGSNIEEFFHVMGPADYSIAYFADGLLGGGPASDYDETPYCEVDIQTVRNLIRCADLLNSSIDELLCHDTPVRAAPEWETGTPEEKLTAYCVFVSGGTEMPMVANYSPASGRWSFPHGSTIVSQCVRWHRLPEVTSK